MPKCAYCSEPVLDHELGQEINNCAEVVHLECFFRMAVGSAEHVNGLCSCFGGTQYEPDTITRREGARRAVEAYRQKMSDRALKLLTEVQ